MAADRLYREYSGILRLPNMFELWVGDPRRGQPRPQDHIAPLSRTTIRVTRDFFEFKKSVCMGEANLLLCPEFSGRRSQRGDRGAGL